MQCDFQFHMTKCYTATWGCEVSDTNA